MSASTGLEVRARRGLFWSLLSNTTLRLGTLLTGIALARILAPEDFGVYAVALTIQTILMTMSELGLAADLVRHGDIEHRGPTIASLSLASSGVLTALMFSAARPLATALGAPDAAPVIQVMSVTLLLAGIGVVPYARLQRGLAQRTLFMIDLVSFVVTTGITVALALNNWGPMSLAIGRVVAQVLATFLQFLLSGERPRYGWDQKVATSGLRFGVPLASAGLLSWILLSLDYVIIGRLVGPTMLGYYVLAFNISSWPTTVIGNALKAVAMPTFAQRSDRTGSPDVEGLRTSSALTWAVAVPIAVALATLAEPLIAAVYGSRWLPAAGALAGLAAFGALRVVFDLWIAYLTAAGRAPTLVWTQVAWIATLGPLMALAVAQRGLQGAGLAHAVVAALIMLPLYLYGLSRSGVPILPMARQFVPPLVAAVPAGVAGWFAGGIPGGPWLQLVLGGVVVVVVYIAALWPWVRRDPAIALRLRQLRRTPHMVHDSKGES